MNATVKNANATATATESTEVKATESKEVKATMNYTYLTTTQKFDGFARLGRAAHKFVKPVMLAVDYSNVAVEFSWMSEMKGLPVMNYETLEIDEPAPFTFWCVVSVNPANMICTVKTVPVTDKEDKVILALCKRYAMTVQSTMDNVDLSPITRTKKEEADNGNEEQ